ncbi:hypothetical protein ACLOJK_020589 [Asimina triloba]
MQPSIIAAMSSAAARADLDRPSRRRSPSLPPIRPRLPATDRDDITSSASVDDDRPLSTTPHRPPLHVGNSRSTSPASVASRQCRQQRGTSPAAHADDRPSLY